MKINSIDELREADEKYRYVPSELSPYQIKMMDNQLSKPNSIMWNNAVYIKFNKDINIKELREAVEKSVSRHPVYNTRIYMDVDGVIRQQCCPQFVPITTANVTDEEMKDIMGNFIRPFQVFNAPLTRFELYKTESAAYVLIDGHHLVIDAFAGSVIVNEIIETLLNPEKEWEPDYYIGYMALEREYKKTEEYAREKEFYENAYEGQDWYSMPKPDIDTVVNKPGTLNKYMEGIDIQSLAQAEKKFRTTRSRLANIAALLTLSKYGNADNVMMTWIYSNRVGIGKDRMGGMLITELPIAARLKEFETLGELILHVNKQMKETTKNVSYDYIVKNEAAFVNDPMEINYKGASVNKDIFIDRLVEKYGVDYIEYQPMENADVAEARLEIDIIEYPDEAPGEQILFNMNYMSSIYKEETVERFADIYGTMFRRLVEADKDTAISELLI